MDWLAVEMEMAESLHGAEQKMKHHSGTIEGLALSDHEQWTVITQDSTESHRQSIRGYRS